MTMMFPDRDSDNVGDALGTTPYFARFLLSRSSFVLLLTAILPVFLYSVRGAPSFVNFETPTVHPIALGPDGQTLAVCNLPDGRVEFFRISNGVPVAAGSVPVGIDPVSARFATTNELWVVNHISSTISIVNVTEQRVSSTIETPPGPFDVVFSGSPRRAWVSCSRTNSVMVIDLPSLATQAVIGLQGERPRAVAVSPDGTKVYVAIFESGNGTTLLGPSSFGPVVSPVIPTGPLDLTNSPYGGLNPPPNSGSEFVPPLNGANGLPPRVSHIVRKNSAGRWMDDNNADWTEWVSGTNAALSGRVTGWDLPDRDVAIIDTATLAVSYAGNLMNICMSLAVNPVSGQIAVIGTDAKNEVRFEPNLNGVFLRVNLALVDPVTLTNRVVDLNPHLDYLTRTLSSEMRALSLGDPRAVEWNSNGTRAYIAGMGSRNMVVVDASGNRVSTPIELLEGPAGIALDEPRERAYVWNRFSSSISVVDLANSQVVTNVSVFDPTPEIIRKGRRHLYDTRKTSGLGIVSCASCHVDARVDRLAWDLGNPAGDVVIAAGSIFHPMKGPMVTQTFQDIINTNNTFNGLEEAPLHWRGDRKDITAFNSTFTDLLSNDVMLDTNEMSEFRGMLASITFPPNYLRTFSNTLSTSVPLPGHLGHTNASGIRQPLPSGNAVNGFSIFQLACGPCHRFNRGLGLFGPNGVIALGRSGPDAFKFAQLRSLQDKLGVDFGSTNSRSGFGLLHDGRVDNLTRFLTEGFAGFTSDQAIANMVALLLSFTGSDVTPNVSSSSQDVPAGVGRQITFHSVAPSFVDAMQGLAAKTNSRVELIIRGQVNGVTRGWMFRRNTGLYESDRAAEPPFTLTQIVTNSGPGNEYTATIVPEGTGSRLALDRDADSYYDTDERAARTNPANPASYPFRIVSAQKISTNLVLSWQPLPGATHVVEWTTNFPLNGASLWMEATGASTLANDVMTQTIMLGEGQRFFRIRSTP